MRWVAVGQSPTGVIAIGQVPTGVVAIGQGATGVIAIGQLARGVVAVGQLAVGVVAFGQLAIGLAWGGGMVAYGGVGGPALLGTETFGTLPLRALLRCRVGAGAYRLRTGRRGWLTIATWFAALALVWFVALHPLWHDLTRDGGILHDEPGDRVLR